MKKFNFTYVVFGIFAAVGAILLIVCFGIMTAGKKFDAVAVTVTGTISAIESHRDSDGDRHYSAYVDYTYQGREYSGIRLNSYSSGMYEGKEIAIKIDPAEPGVAKAANTYLIASAILAGLGVIFFLVGIIPVLIEIKKQKKKKMLLEHGRYVYAIVEQITENYGYSVNGRHPFVVYCNYQDEYSGVLYKFKSDNVWTNPEPIIQPGSEIRVYVNESDYSQYHVDIEGSLKDKVVDYT